MANIMLNFPSLLLISDILHHFLREDVNYNHARKADVEVLIYNLISDNFNFHLLLLIFKTSIPWVQYRLSRFNEAITSSELNIKASIKLE